MGYKEWRERRKKRKAEKRAERAAKKEEYMSTHNGKNRLEYFFTESKFIKGVKAIAPDVLDVVGNISGIGAFNRVSDMIDKRQDIPADVKEKLLELHKMELDELKLLLDDTKDARDLQKVALRQEDRFSKRFVYYLAIIIISAAILFGAALMFLEEIPEGNKRLVEMFADIFLFSGGLVVIQFFFGSSKGSRDKDTTSNQ